jgi:membrane protease YdiL (CAAX protease family)
MATGDLNPEYRMDEVLPAEDLPPEPEVTRVLPAPRPPHPNIWWSLLWCFGILASLYGTIFAAAIPIFVGSSVMARLRGVKNKPEETISHNQVEENGQTSPEESKDTEERIRQANYDPLRSEVYRDLAIPMFLGEVVSAALAVVTLRIFVGKNWMRVVGLRRPSIGQVVLVLIALPGMITLPNMIQELAKYVGVPTFQGSEDMAQMLGSWSLGFGVLVVGVGPGLGEELWCRAFLGRGLVGNYGIWLGVLLTSALFGIMHIDPANAIAITFIGAWLHFTYLTTRSLVVPMVLHALNNSCAVFAAVVGLQKEAWDKQLENAIPPNQTSLQIVTWFEGLEKLALEHPYPIAAGCIILLAAVAWALYSSRTRLVVSADETVPPWRPDFPGVEFPPPGSVTRVYRPWLGLLPSAVVLAGIGAFAGCCYYAYSLS